MIGSTLAHYRITAKLGEGGMGEVYLAEDAKLQRQVALKVLPEEMAADPERLERFEQEARSIAALNHPNIVTIHSVEEAGTTHLLTMELVNGQSLDQILPPTGFELDRFFPIATQIADGLAAAHDKGITHRDLKPANVMVTDDGRVKILDFGLAKLAASEEPTDDATQLLTQDGMILGTVPYMSPEQAQSKPVDPRSDVFSLGILLYEMATGSRPFQGDNPASVVSAVLKDHPAPLTTVKAELPNHLGRIVQRCLEKDPERRYQSAKDVRNEIDALREELRSGASSFGPAAEPAATGPGDTGRHPAASPDSVTLSFDRKRLWPMAAVAVVGVAVLGWLLWGTRTSRDGDLEAGVSAKAVETSSERPRLVVIPFENLGSSDDDYFAAGMTEEITSRLAAVEDLAVVSRKSALLYAGTDKTMAEIGDELGVAYILEGTVRWAASADGASRVRITPQLSDVEADTAVWSQTFDRELDDVFAIQSEIAQAVVSQLGVEMLGNEEASLAARPTKNLEAYQEYLRGRYFMDAASYAAVPYHHAAKSLERAVALDGDFGPAWAALAEIHARIYHFGYDASESRREAARLAVEQAQRAAPEAGETYMARGFYRYYCFQDYDAAVELYRQAAKRLPDPTDALEAEAYVLRRQARFDEAARQLERTLGTNPRDPKRHFDLGESLIYARRYPDAIAAFVTSEALQPTGNMAGAMKAWAHWLWQGSRGLRDARAALEAPTNDPEAGYFLHFYLWQLVYEGRDEEALVFLAENVKSGWIRHPELAYPTDLARALILERAGHGDEALEAYRRAAEAIERGLEEAPQDYRLHGSLGLAYAGFGRPEEAIASARRGTELMPLERDALNGPARLWELAAVQAKVGEAEAALDSYERLIEFTGAYSLPFLELDVFMDPLRDHPRYKALVASHAAGG